MTAGTSTSRTTVASTKDRGRQADAHQLEEHLAAQHERPNTATMIAAAAVITRAVRARPWDDRLAVLPRARYSSRIRERRNTS